MADAPGKRARRPLRIIAAANGAVLSLGAIEHFHVKGRDATTTAHESGAVQRYVALSQGNE